MDTSQPPIAGTVDHPQCALDTGSSESSSQSGVDRIFANKTVDTIVSSEPPAFLVGVVGPAEGVLAELEDSMYIVGRSGQSSIRVDDCRMSREHVLLLVKPNGDVTMFDLHASNGTVVNGTKIKRALLNEGDRIEIGESVFRFARERPRVVVAANSPVDETTC